MSDRPYGDRSAEALKEILRLYDFRDSAETRTLIDGIARIVGSTREKFVVFAFFKGTLRYLHRRLQADGVSSILLHGGGGLDKDQIVDTFATVAQSDRSWTEKICAMAAARGTNFGYLDGLNDNQRAAVEFGMGGDALSPPLLVIAFMIAFLLIVVWSTDIAAYFGGAALLAAVGVLGHRGRLPALVLDPR